MKNREDNKKLEALDMEVIYVKGWRSCGQKKHPGSYWKEEMDARDPKGDIDRI